MHIDNRDNNTDPETKTVYISIGSMTVARVENNTATYLHHDSLGSPVAGTTEAGGVKWRERYSPYGITLDNDTSNKDQAGYTGHIKDGDTGLTYMQARYYDPVIGRFYSNDPIGYRDVHSFNRYTYANNNPYKYTDPDGKAACLGLCVALVITAKIAHKAYKVHKANKLRNRASKAYGASIQVGIAKQAANLIYEDSGHSGIGNHKVAGGVVGALWEEATNGSFASKKDGTKIWHGQKAKTILGQLNKLEKRVNAKGSPLNGKQKRGLMKQINVLKGPLSKALKAYNKSSRVTRTGTRIRQR